MSLRLTSLSVCLSLGFSLSVMAQNWSGILSPSRAVDWSTAGVSGGIPSGSWTQCGATIAAYSGSPSTISNAIAACGTNQYVQLGAGTFNLSGGIVTGRNNVELRGMGADQTFLIFTGNTGCQGAWSDICFQSSDTNWSGKPSNGPVNWTAPSYAKGSTTLVLASVPNLKVGNPIILDQLDDLNTSDTGSIFVCSENTTSPICSLSGNGGNAPRSGRDQMQIVQVTSCGGVSTPGAACSGTNVTITISPGLYMPNWDPSKTPQAWWATGPIQNVGVQNLSMDNTAVSGTIGIAFFNVFNGWARGIRSRDSARAHVQAQYSARITARDNYFYLTQNSLAQSYGFECFGGSDNLVENTIFQAVSGPLMINSACSGTVLSYNYAINDFFTGAGWVNAMTNFHTAGTDNLLYEGNIGPEFMGDVFHGTRHFGTFFRNYLWGMEPVCWQSGSTTNYPANIVWGPCTNELTPVVLQSFSRFFNVIGNVLGTAGTSKTYQSQGGSGAIYDLGYGNGVPTDPNVAITLMRWGNYDAFNNASNFNPAEVPSALSGSQAPYSNPVPASNALPNSFYVSGKPSWWPSTTPWPPIGPDVTGGNILQCTSGTYARSYVTSASQCAGGTSTPVMSGKAYANPAMACYLNIMNGAPDGTGPLLSFNADTCYGAQVAPPPAPQPPPTISAAAH